VNANPAAPELRALAPGFAGRFAAIVAGLAALIARAFLRHPSLAPLILPLCGRLTRNARHLATLMARLARYGAIRHGATRRGEASGPATGAQLCAPKAAGGFSLEKPRKRTRPLAPRERCPIPTTHAWLVRTLHHEAAAYASQLSHLLAEPGVSELLDAAPTARRLLRPLCRMLGLPDTALRAVARQATSDTPPTGGVARQATGVFTDTQRSVVARQATGVFPFKNPESVLASSLPPPPAMAPPPCPHLRFRWPWVPHPHAKTA
jgi:hypothetical protein